MSCWLWVLILLAVSIKTFDSIVPIDFLFTRDMLACIALTAFSEDSLISLALVIERILQLPILALPSQVLLRIRNSSNNLS